MSLWFSRYWVVRAGLPILWLILNDIYKPAPTDVSVRYDGNTFFVFDQILSPSNTPYGLVTAIILLLAFLATWRLVTQITSYWQKSK